MRSALVPILLADPMPWAYKAPNAWDFLKDRARFAGGNKGALANTPGWSFTRASTGYAQTAAGVLVPFASGELRITDKGVLIEGAGTNLCLQSQTFDNATWTKTNATVTANAIAAPDGTTTADKLVEDSTATVQHRLNQVITVSSGAAYTFSVFVKAAERLNINMRISTVSGNADASFNLQAGTALTPSVGTSSIFALGNGWYRCCVTGTTDGTSATVRINLGNTASNPTQGTYTGDGASGVYLWGAQLEAAAFPSSYIPTTTASATRAADVLTVPVSGIDYPLSLYAEFERSVDTGGSEVIFAAHAGSSNDESILYVNGSDQGTLQTRVGSVTQSNISVSGAIAASVTTKLAGGIGTDSVRLARAGSLATPDTSATNPSAPTTLVFGNRALTDLPSYGYLRRVAIFSRALSDGELQALTT